MVDARERDPRDAAWLLLAPLGLGAYALYLGLAEGDALRFLHAHEAWYRELSWPLAGVWEGLGAAIDGFPLASGSASRLLRAAAGTRTGSRRST